MCRGIGVSTFYGFNGGADGNRSKHSSCVGEYE